MMKGIDVSRYNGEVDWKAAKAAGLGFALLRCGYGSDLESQDDPQFARNVRECDANGIPWGAYLYSYALNPTDAKSELQHLLRLLKGKRPLFPVYLDMEDADGYKAKRGMPSREVLTEIVKTVCAGLEDAGYLAGYYANRDWMETKLFPEKLSGYSFWYARPGVEKPDRACDVWQSDFPSTGGKWPGANIPGSGCDTDESFVDYPARVRQEGKNGWPKPAAATQPARAADSGEIIETTCVLDTTMDVEKPLGTCYTLKLTCPQKPAVTAGSEGVCVCPLSADGKNTWLCNLVGYQTGEVGIYTQVPGEEVCLRFRYRVT